MFFLHVACLLALRTRLQARKQGQPKFKIRGRHAFVSAPSIPHRTCEHRSEALTLTRYNIRIDPLHLLRFASTPRRLPSPVRAPSRQDLQLPSNFVFLRFPASLKPNFFLNGSQKQTLHKTHLEQDLKYEREKNLPTCPIPVIPISPQAYPPRSCFEIRPSLPFTEQTFPFERLQRFASVESSKEPKNQTYKPH